MKHTPTSAKLAWLIVALLGLCGPLLGQPVCQVFFYDEEDGLPHGHVTQMLQDRHGFLWFSTWNGLCRYDGYAFQSFKPTAGDGCSMATDRIRDIALLPGGNILCKEDDNYYLFDTGTYRFRDLTAEQRLAASKQMLSCRQSHSLSRGGQITWSDPHGTRWTLDASSHLAYQLASGVSASCPLQTPIPSPSFALSDHQGNLWVLSTIGVYKLCTSTNRTQPLPHDNGVQTKSLYTDKKGRVWLTTKEDATVRLYAPDGHQLLGYLDEQGHLHQQHRTFGHSIFCVYQSADGIFWMGSKPDGLFRLKETREGHFECQPIATLPSTNVYSIVDDPQGRLWVATLGGGIYVCEQPHADHPTFRTPAAYPSDGTSQRVRFLHITKNGILMAATTDGLLVSRLERDAHQMRFRRHCREPERANSLSSSAIMDILEDPRGRIYVSTESGGINRVEGTDLLAEQLPFRHINTTSHQLPGDVTLSLTNGDDGGLLVVGDHYLCLIDTAGHVRVLDAHFFNADFRYSEAHPQRLADGRWLFGLNRGAFTIPATEMRKNTRHQEVVLTGATIQGKAGHWDAEAHDTLTLLSDERNVTVHFAAIDYCTAERINYAFRLITHGDSDTTWNTIGHDRSVTLLDLKPGTYLLEIRSTDAEGEWLDNTRSLTIRVEPKFWESSLGRLIVALLTLAVIAIVAYTIYYIRKLRRQQHKTLEAYLALLNTSAPPPSTEETPVPSPPSDSHPPHHHLTPEDDALMKRLMAFIEANIDNSDLRIADMASAVATSASGLQRKVKQAMGITPQDLLREARIKHACLLLKTTGKSIAEVAYACGFSDPKYFGRCFKASVGQSPTEYKNTL